MYGCATHDVFASGIDRPSGLFVDEAHVYVGEYGSGKIMIFDKSSGQLMTNVSTGVRAAVLTTTAAAAAAELVVCFVVVCFANVIFMLILLLLLAAAQASGLMGLALSPLDGALWFVDGAQSQLGRVVVDTPCGMGSTANASTGVPWSASPACNLTPLLATPADRERFHSEAFLNTHNSSNYPAEYPADYANMTQSQCDLVNFDVLLMEGFLCHICE